MNRRCPAWLPCGGSDRIGDWDLVEKKSMDNFRVTSASVSTANTFGAASPGAEAATEVAASLNRGEFCVPCDCTAARGRLQPDSARRRRALSVGRFGGLIQWQARMWIPR